MEWVTNDSGYKTDGPLFMEFVTRLESTVWDKKEQENSDGKFKQHRLK